MSALEREITTIREKSLNLEEVAMDYLDIESANNSEGLCVDSYYVWIPLLENLESLGFLEKEQQSKKIYCV